MPADPVRPLPSKEKPLTPAMRGLVGAIAAGTPAASQQQAVAIAEAVQTLIREELGRDHGEAAMRLSRPR